jgi:hypothetical protein
VTRRIAFQSLVAIICGAWTENQKKAATQVPTKPGTLKVMTAADINSPVSLRIYMGWKDITVVRGEESVVIDQDELFRALKEER